MTSQTGTHESAANEAVFRSVRTAEQLECIVSGLRCDVDDTIYVREYDTRINEYTGVTVKRTVKAVERVNDADLLVTLARDEAASSFFASPGLWQSFGQTGKLRLRESSGA
jgi:hypothetical protein